MKIAATLAALVAAEDANWPGQSVENTCGSLVTRPTGDSPINATCTIKFADGLDPWFVSVPGVFWTSPNTFTSFDGVVDGDAEVEVLVFWRQYLDDAGELDNSTCPLTPEELAASVEVKCEDDGEAEDEENLIGNFAFAPDNHSYQVPVANPTASFQADLSAFGDVNSLTCNGDAMEASGSSLTCIFSTEQQLGYFGFNGTDAPDLPNASFL